ncbi:hypothetical protein [Halomonas sp. M20]|uniref:hypothetical protein n=1 Tax=Halomonas sp. M20 TaxID=2763264 RepID=UPI001D0AD496|nr:hypothetical protein [Halomonas sp. M20]
MEFKILYKETAADETDFRDVKNICSENEINCSLVKVRATDPQALLEWLIPTAVVVYIAGPFAKSYFGKLGEKAAEATVDVIKNLARKCFGKQKTIDEQLFTVGGKAVESEFSRNMSFAFPMKNGKMFRLLLTESITDEKLEIAFLHFLTLQKMYQDDPDSCPLTPWSENNEITRNWDQLACFNEETEMMEFVDYVKSDIQKRIVSCPIDDAWEYHC